MCITGRPETYRLEPREEGVNPSDGRVVGWATRHPHRMHIRFATMAVEVLAGINENAPVVGRSEIEIAAAPATVWEVLTSFEHWPNWLRDVKSMSMQGPVAVGSVFRWKAGPGTITSTIQRVEPPQLIAWTGRTFGIRAIHFWNLEARDGGTFIRTAESYEGLVSRLFRRPLQKTLDRALDDGLHDLKAEVERRAS